MLRQISIGNQNCLLILREAQATRLLEPSIHYFLLLNLLFAFAAVFICYCTVYSLNLFFLFVFLRYNEKKWVSRGRIQPAPVVNQLSCKVSHSVERGHKPETPTKTRTRSLDEDILLKHVLEVTPPETRIRAVWCLTKLTWMDLESFHLTLSTMQGSVDMKMKENVYVLPLPVGINVNKPNQKNEIFSGDLYQNRRTTIAPPSSWATFDCKA